MPINIKTLVFSEKEKQKATVKITAPSQKPLPLAVTAPKSNIINAKTATIFSNNLAYYEKGGNGHGGGAKPVGNHRAVSKRT